MLVPTLCVESGRSASYHAFPGGAWERAVTELTGAQFVCWGDGLACYESSAQEVSASQQRYSQSMPAGKGQPSRVCKWWM
jgi:hypothetical protein